MSAADALPSYHHRERHAIRVAAPPARALAAARDVPLADLPLARTLFRLRGLGADPPSGRMWDLFERNGFAPAGDDTFVLVGRPWKLRGDLRPDVGDFASFDEPGFAKLALDLRAVPDGQGTRLETETRIFLTDAAARRSFRRYWLLVRPFSGLTRRAWLRAAKRRAESA